MKKLQGIMLAMAMLAASVGINVAPAEAVVVNMYVGPNGNDDNGWNCQDPGHPCASVAHAADIVNTTSNLTGATIHLEAGSYDNTCSPERCPGSLGIHIQKNISIHGAGIGQSILYHEIFVENSGNLIIGQITLEGSRVLVKNAGASLQLFSAEVKRRIDNWGGTVAVSNSILRSDAINSLGQFTVDWSELPDGFTFGNEGGPSVFSDSMFHGKIGFVNSSGGTMTIQASDFTAVQMSEVLNAGAGSTMQLLQSAISLGDNFQIRNQGGASMVLDGVSIRDMRGTMPVLVNTAVVNGRVEQPPQLAIRQSQIYYNEIIDEPIIQNDYGSLTIEDSAISSNRTLVNGKGIIQSSGTNGSATMSEQLIIRRSDFVSNYAGSGGAIYAQYGHYPLLIEQSTISSNSAEGNGGGVYLRQGAKATIIDSSITNNQAFGGYGGGLYVTGPNTVLSANQTTVAGNFSTRQGGGIYIDGEAHGKLWNVTVAGNTVNAGPDGAGIKVGSGAVVDSANSIIGDNIVNFLGALSNCGGTLTSLGYNLDTDMSCGLNASTDRPGVPSSGLGALGDYGGPTYTMSLLSGQAVDGGNPGGCYGEDATGNVFAFNYDQRGPAFRRHVNGGSGTDQCDMGAFEAQKPVQNPD